LKLHGDERRRAGHTSTTALLPGRGDPRRRQPDRADLVRQVSDLRLVRRIYTEWPLCRHLALRHFAPKALATVWSLMWRQRGLGSACERPRIGESPCAPEHTPIRCRRAVSLLVPPSSHAGQRTHIRRHWLNKSQRLRYTLGGSLARSRRWCVERCVPDKYWAARMLHLSHINLLWHVWELEDRPTTLTQKHSGWDRFAKKVAVELKCSPVSVQWTGGDRRPGSGYTLA
jgi:hypothetical protein